MKNVKSLYAIIGCFILISLIGKFTYGQSLSKDIKDKTPVERAKFQTDLMKSKLNLDSNQSTKIKAINLKYAQKFEPIIKSSDNNLSKLKKAMNLQKLKDEELKKVLSAKQFSDYQKIEDELKAKVKSKM